MHACVYRECFLPWHKTQQKGLNIAKELGVALPECSLISKLSPSELKDVFWMKLTEFQKYILTCLFIIMQAFMDYYTVQSTTSTMNHLYSYIYR